MSAKTTEEQRGTLVALMAALMAFGMAMFVYMGPYRDYNTAQIAYKTAKADLAVALSDHMDAESVMKQQEDIMARIQGRPAHFELSSFLIESLRKLKLESRADLKTEKTNPRLLGDGAENLAMVKLTLKGVSMVELVDLLHAIYSSKNLIAVLELDSMRPGANDKGLDCAMSLITPKS